MRAGLHMLGVVLLAFVTMTCPPHVDAASARAPSLRIHIAISGGYTYSGTLAGPEDPRAGTVCGISRASTGRTYNVTYRADNQFLLGRPTHNGFMLQILGFKPETGHYSSTRDTLIVVIRGHSYYTEGILRVPSRLTVRIAPNHRSGTVDAARLVPTPGLRSRPIHLHASWSCSFVRHG